MAFSSLIRSLDAVPGIRLLKDALAAQRDRSGLPFSTRLRMLRLGFKPESFVLFEFDRNDPAAFLPDRYWRALADVDGETVKEVLGNKLLFQRTYEDELPMPALLATVCRGRLVPEASAVEPIASPAALLEHASRHGPLILKPIRGQKGKHVHAVAMEDGRVHVDGRPASAAQAADLIAGLDGVMVSEFVRQASYAAEIFPHSANSLRIVTMRDADSGEPFVAAAAHRFGRAASAPVDNVSSGGLVAGVVDTTVGVLGPMQAFTPRPASLQWLDRHPDTGAPVRGLVVPGWSDVVASLLAFCRRHPHLSYVGWDVVKTDDGMRVLEANYGAGLQIQAFRPYLADARIVGALRASGILQGSHEAAVAARSRLTPPAARSYTSRDE
jgi:hypothetical protein